MNTSPTKIQKIMFVITKSNFGGAQRYVFDLAKALTKDGNEVVVLSGGEGILLEKLAAENIRTITIPYLERDINLLADIKTFFAFVKYIYHERPDVLHVNSAKAGGLGALAGRMLFVPHIIFTAHGWAFNEERGALSKKVIAFLSWATIFLAHTTIANSEATFAHIPRWLQKKIAIIRNGVHPIRLLEKNEARNKIRERCPSLPEENQTWIGTIAELHHVKGLLFAVEAMVSLRERGLSPLYVVLGEGDQRTHLEAAIKEYDLEQSVFLPGFMEDAAQYLNAFDLFVLPSISEGLGYVLLEAGLASLPAIGTNVGGIPEIIEDSKNGILVPPRDAAKLADAIELLLSDTSMGAKLGKELHTLVEGPFAFETMYQETLNVYQGK